MVQSWLPIHWFPSHLFCPKDQFEAADSLRALGLLSDARNFPVDFLVVDSHGIGAAKVQDDPAFTLLLPFQILESDHGCCVRKRR